MGLMDRVKAEVAAKRAEAQNAPAAPTTTQPVHEATKAQSPLASALIKMKASGISPPDAPPYVKPEPPAAAATAATEESPPKRVEPPKPKKSVPTAVATADFMLFLDCLPVKGLMPRPVDELLIPVREALQSQAGKDGQPMPYRLIEFNKGPALLAAQLEDYLEMNPPAGIYTVISKTLDREVLDALVRRASIVMKGTI